MARKPTRLRKKGVEADLNLTPVMNLFMVLIPFLLLTAVFARTAIIEIHLPQEGQVQEPAKKDKKKPEVLTISLTKKGFVFSGLGKKIKRINKKDGEYDFELLTKKLLGLKKKYPEREEVILLFHPDMKYELVVRMMDTTRETVVTSNGISEKKKLYPVLSVGEIAE